MYVPIMKPAPVKGLSWEAVRGILDLVAMALITLVTFFVLLTVVERLADTSHHTYVLNGSLSANRPADYSGGKDIKIAPQRPGQAKRSTP